MPADRIVEFACPGCKLPCQLNLATKGLRHQLPTCAVYERTKTDAQEFLLLAKVTTMSQPEGAGRIKRIE
jgi:hypothetical protein